MVLQEEDQLDLRGIDVGSQSALRTCSGLSSERLVQPSNLRSVMISLWRTDWLGWDEVEKVDGGIRKGQEMGNRTHTEREREEEKTHVSYDAYQP